jgi:hypothetical protein
MTVDGNEVTTIKSKSQSFRYFLFHKHPEGGVLPIPIDGEQSPSLETASAFTQEAEQAIEQRVNDMLDWSGPVKIAASK